MSKLNQLIQRLCPDGVENAPLWSVTIWDKKFSGVDRKKQPKIINYNYLLASDLFSLETDSGNVFLLSTGEKTGWTTEELAGDDLHEGEVVTIPWGKSRAVTDCIKYYKGKFVTADNRIMTSNDPAKLSNRYLYYWVMSVGKTIDTFYRGSGIKHPDMVKILDLKIPVPPLPVQQEIVRILDQFTQLTAELTVELTARDQQYKYYLNQLLEFEDEPIWVELGTVTKSVNTGLNPRRFFKLNTDDASNYYVTIREIQNNSVVFSEKTDRINDEALQLCNNRSNLEIGDILFSGTGTIGETAVVEKTPTNWNIKEGVYSIKPLPEKLNSRFLMYLLHTNKIKAEIFKKVAGGTVKSIPMGELRKLKIPVPPLSEQERLVNLIDRFDALCNDLTSGLPAEIAARQKQYEYYRDQLLTFPERKEADA